MIAKIGKGENIIGVLSYNQLKIEKENGKVLLLNKIPETLNGKYSVAHFYKSFEPYLLANIKTEKPVRHISLNPDPVDKVSDEQFCSIAQQYLKEMGYGNQPYAVFKHTDIERTHIHIVTTCVQLNGRKIPDGYDHPRSMAICRAIEKDYDLHPALESGRRERASQIFKPVDYAKGDVKSQIASVTRHLPKYYQYPTLGTYNALLSLFNITVEEVKGEIKGQTKQGLVYFALDENGRKISKPFKSSLFGKDAGLAQLQNHFIESKEKMKTANTRNDLKNMVEIARSITSTEGDFKKHLLEQGINTVVRRNEDGRIYGMTFIDHNSRSVWNGSQLCKDLSANAFTDYWERSTKPEFRESTLLKSKGSESKVPEKLEEPHHLFDFLNTTKKHEDNLIEGLGGLLPEAHGEDYEEQDFANKMKKKRKRN